MSPAGPRSRMREKARCGFAVNHSETRVGVTDSVASAAGSLRLSAVCGTINSASNAAKCDMGVEDGAALSSRQPRMTILPALTFGLLLGLRHATDADHIAAVGTMASSNSEWWRT